MPTLEEVNQLLLAVAGLRDTMDADNEVVAVQKEVDASDDEGVADNLDAEMDALRVTMDSQARGATQVQNQAMRVGIRQTALRRKRATNLRMNARRLRSVNHDVERDTAIDI